MIELLRLGLNIIPTYRHGAVMNPLPSPSSSSEHNSCRLRVVCRCLQVTEQAVLDALAIEEIHTVKELRQSTGAGDGCTACHKLLRRLLEMRSLQSASSSPEPICSVR